MKTIHVNWEHMWEKYFSDYPGWASIVECKHSRRRHSEEDYLEDLEKQKNCYRFSNSDDTLFENKVTQTSTHLDRLYDVNKDQYTDYYIITEPSPKEEAPQTENEIKAPLCDADITPKEGALGEIIDKCSDKSLIRCKVLGKQPDDIIFECGTGQGFAFVANKGETLTYTPHKTCIPKTLGTIAIDTTCLKKPKTKVLFSCNISFIPRNEEAMAQLEFVLYRSCNNSEESVVGNWAYDVIDKRERSEQTFRFIFCSCSSFPGCYNYFVRVIPVFIKDCSVCLTNCHMDAVAQSI